MTTHALALFGTIVVLAALVNKWRPAHRFQVRRVVILFAFYLAAHGIHHLLRASGETAWARRLLVGADLLEAFTIVNIAATATFAVLLPAVDVVLPGIANDLLMACGYVLATLGVLSTHDIDAPTSIIASAAVVSAALVISLQSTLGNVLGGVALQLDGSIHEGDWIQLENGRQGRIRSIRWRHTVVETRDWSTIIVPNASLLASQITILGRRDGKNVPQRMWVWFNVDFRFAPTRVIQVVTDALCAAPIAGVASDPLPNCVCMDFTKERRESFATYAVRYWLTDLAADDPTSSRVRARIFTALRRADIPFAMPAQTHWVDLEDGDRKKRKTELELEGRFRTLRELPLFRALTDAELQTLASGLGRVVYTAGELVTRQGAVAHWLYILTSGKVEIRTAVDPDGEGPAPAENRFVTTLEGPDVFGEMGLMTGAPRTANVLALTDVECLRLDKRTFERVLLDRPEIADELSSMLATRKVELVAVQEDLDEEAKSRRADSERDKILRGIRSFFGL